MNPGRGIQRSLELYLKNFALVFPAALVAVAISGATFGLLAGPLIGGLVALILKLRRGEKAGFNEIFAHFDRFAPTLVVSLLTAAAFIVLGVFNGIVGSIWVVGWLVTTAVNLCLYPALYLVALLSLAFVVDKKIAPIDAIKKAVGCLLTNPVQIWLYALVIGAIGALGLLLTVPLTAIGILGGGFFGIFLALLLMPACYTLTAPVTLIGYVDAYEDLSVKEPGTLKINRQTLQIAGIVVAALILVGLVSRFAFHRAASGFNPFGRIFSRGVFNRGLNIKTGEGKISFGGDGESFQIETDRGSLSFGSELPKNFPKDVPIYPGAKVESSLATSGDSGSMTTLSTSDSADEVYDYYARELGARGWETEQEFFGRTYKKDDRRVTIMANDGDEGEETTIMLTISRVEEEE